MCVCVRILVYDTRLETTSDIINQIPPPIISSSALTIVIGGTNATLEPQQNATHVASVRTTQIASDSSSFLGTITLISFRSGAPSAASVFVADTLAIEGTRFHSS